MPLTRSFQKTDGKLYLVETANEGCSAVRELTNREIRKYKPALLAMGLLTVAEREAQKRRIRGGH